MNNRSGQWGGRGALDIYKWRASLRIRERERERERAKEHTPPFSSSMADAPTSLALQLPLLPCLSTIRLPGRPIWICTVPSMTAPWWNFLTGTSWDVQTTQYSTTRYVDTSSYLLAFFQLSERASERRSVVARLWIRLHRIPGSWLDPTTAPPVGGDAGFNAFLFLVEGG